MGRRRKHGVQLPEHVHRVTSRGKEYFYYQPHRGTERAEKAEPLPHDPASVKFWREIERLTGKTRYEKGTVSHLISEYKRVHGFPQGEDDKPDSELSDATIENYTVYLGKLQSLIGEFQAADIKPKHMLAIQDEMRNTPSAANQMIRVAGTLFKWGVPREFCDINPCREIQKLKAGDGWKPWPEWAFKMMREEFRDIVRLACELALYTGQRQSDVLKMKLSDFDGDGIRVKQQKTGKELWIPIHRELRPVIAECRKRGSMYLVAEDDGTPLTPKQFRQRWTTDLKKEPLTRFKKESIAFHGLRKSAAVKLREAGCSTGHIQSITGMSLEMVEHYTKGVDQRKMARAAMAQWEQNED